MDPPPWSSYRLKRRLLQARHRARARAQAGVARHYRRGRGCRHRRARHQRLRLLRLGAQRSGQADARVFGTREVTFASLVWFHGGGLPATLNIAQACAILAGQADVVAIYRSMAERSSQRLRVIVAQNDTSSQYLVNGLDSPAQILALRAQRHDAAPRGAAIGALRDRGGILLSRRRTTRMRMAEASR